MLLRTRTTTACWKHHEDWWGHSVWECHPYTTQSERERGNWKLKGSCLLEYSVNSFNSCKKVYQMGTQKGTIGLKSWKWSIQLILNEVNQGVVNKHCLPNCNRESLSAWSAVLQSCNEQFQFSSIPKWFHTDWGTAHTTPQFGIHSRSLIVVDQGNSSS